MRRKLLAVLGLGGLLAVGPAAADPLTFTSFASSAELVAATGDDAAIGFAFAGDKFVGSIYYNNQLYKTDLGGAGVQKFGAPLPIASGSAGEIYVSSSLGLDGWGSSRDVYAGSQFEGTVWKYDNGATTADGATVFVSGLSGGVRSIAFDPYGNYGYDMIVATSTGNVYRVNSSGTASLLASLGTDSEGLSFTEDPFGPFGSGTLVVLSEGSGRVNAIAPTGAVTDLGVQFNAPEMLSFVPLDFVNPQNALAGFYAARYPTEVVHAPAANFAPFAGQAIITEENSWNIYALSWNSGNSVFEKTLIQSFGGQPEDGIFVTSTIIGCDRTPQGCPVPEPASLMLVSLGLAGMAARIASGRRR